MRGLLIGVAAAAAAATFAGYWMFYMPGKSGSATPRRLEPQQLALRERLRGHVQALAGRIGPRHPRRPQALEDAADYVHTEFARIGYRPLDLGYGAGAARYRNVQVELPGVRTPEQIVVIGAHYDTVAESPGADDNASGVAALIELARLGQHRDYARTLRFVAFANEELPYGGTPAMGSFAYAQAAAQAGENIVGAISLETLGYYTAAPHSQRYPIPLSWLYPSTGHFLAFIANLRSRTLLTEAIGAFRRAGTLPSEGIAAPELLRDIARSDHSSFWRAGYPAIMVTDTAPFRYPHYHTAEDTPERVDFDSLTRAVIGLHATINHLAGPLAAPAGDDVAPGHATENRSY